MPDHTQAAMADSARPHQVYAALEERVMARDQVGASAVYYDLVKSGRPIEEMLAEAVRIHAPYTHVPYHERIDEGYVNFVNNDHCLLSARATLHLSRLLPGALSGLPMAQTIWYIPTGLDIWNQKIIKAPGHYARGFKMPEGPPPAPAVHWPDQSPQVLDGPLGERLDHWMTLVHRGQVIDAYRVYLGLMANPAERREVLAQLAFAGLIDVQDRSFQNRSYTTGHKSFRARATVELGEALGWDRAHDVLYAGALDIAVGPRWYSTYEFACNAVKVFIDGEELHAVPYRGSSERERALLRNTEPLSAAESAGLIDSLLNEHDPAWIEKLTLLLKAGRGPRRILDAIQVGCAEVVLRTHGDLTFSLPQHCYEYNNTLGWFWDSFDHQHRLKLLYLAASYLNQNAWHQRNTGEMHPPRIEPQPGAEKLNDAALLDRLEAAVIGLDAPQALGLAQAWLDGGRDSKPIVQRMALAASRIGNDPHNQEIALCMLEDYGKSRDPARHKLLLACVQHTARHRKYGDFLDCARRYGSAMGLAELQ